MGPEAIKGVVRPVFANYDIVVYFGCGLFSLPAINRYYIVGFGFSHPKFEAFTPIPWVNQGISALCFLFGIYVLGHAIAYLASQFIEKFLEIFFGKTSTAVLWTSLSRSRTRNSRVRDLIKFRLAKSFSRDRWIATIIRLAPHIFMIPAYVAIYYIGAFGFISSRISSEVIARCRQKLADRGMGDIYIAANKPWYKPIEQWVINNNPLAVPRMYNYLVISGLFRSLSFIVLVVFSFEFVMFVHWILTAHTHVAVFLSGSRDVASFINALIVLAGFFAICIFSYAKFQRRYIEETIFAFAYAPEGSPSSRPTD